MYVRKYSPTIAIQSQKARLIHLIRRKIIYWCVIICSAPTKADTTAVHIYLKEFVEGTIGLDALTSSSIFTLSQVCRQPVKLNFMNPDMSRTHSGDGHIEHHSVQCVHGWAWRCLPGRRASIFHSDNLHLVQRCSTPTRFHLWAFLYLFLHYIPKKPACRFVTPEKKTPVTPLVSSCNALQI